MNIALVVDDFHGGAGNIVQLLATELSKEHNVSMIMTNLHSDKRYALEDIAVYDENISIMGKNKLVGLLSAMGKMRKLIKRIKADVVISFIDNNNSLVCLSMLGCKTPVVVSERSNPLVIFPKAPWDKIRRIAYRRANIVTVQFNDFSSFDGNRFSEKCHVTSNIVEKPLYFKENYDTDTVRFVTVGRLQGIKRMDLMIELFDMAHKENPDIELHIFGDGPQKGDLNKLIKQKGLENKVFLRGYCNEVHKTLAEFDVYLMTSLQEGFPNSLCEAMAVGLPSVSIACHKGVEELGKFGEYGFTAPEGDKKEFVRKMLMLASDVQLRSQMGSGARSISETYSKEKIMGQWRDCIREAMEK